MVTAPARIPLRPDFDAARVASLSSLTRACIATARAACGDGRPTDIAQRAWGRDASVDYILRGVSAPAATSAPGWAAELTNIAATFVASLSPISAGSALLAKGLQLKFNGAGALSVPSITPSPATFIAEGAPIPVGEFRPSTALRLEPHKLALVVLLTREMLDNDNCEQIIKVALSEAAALGLDSALFSASAATASAPAGLLNGVAALPASTSTPAADAMTADLAKIGGAVARVAGGNLVFICSPEQALAINLRSPQFAYLVLASRALAAGTVICIAADALVSASEAMPIIDASRETAVHRDTAALELVAAGGQVATPLMSTFQTDNVALRMKLPVTWAMRASGAIAWVNGVSW